MPISYSLVPAQTKIGCRQREDAVMIETFLQSLPRDRELNASFLHSIQDREQNGRLNLRIARRVLLNRLSAHVNSQTNFTYLIAIVDLLF